MVRQPNIVAPIRREDSASKTNCLFKDSSKVWRDKYEK
jgi:hypothetical protein